MDRVEEIESLPPEEFTRIARWFRERDQALWDRELDADSASRQTGFPF
jgi:hypothetical protein